MWCLREFILVVCIAGVTLGMPQGSGYSKTKSVPSQAQADAQLQQDQQDFLQAFANQNFNNAPQLIRLSQVNGHPQLAQIGHLGQFGQLSSPAYQYVPTFHHPLNYHPPQAPIILLQINPGLQQLSKSNRQRQNDKLTRFRVTLDSGEDDEPESSSESQSEEPSATYGPPSVESTQENDSQEVSMPDASYGVPAEMPEIESQTEISSQPLMMYGVPKEPSSQYGVPEVSSEAITTTTEASGYPAAVTTTEASSGGYPASISEPSAEYGVPSSATEKDAEEVTTTTEASGGYGGYTEAKVDAESLAPTTTPAPSGGYSEASGGYSEASSPSTVYGPPEIESTSQNSAIGGYTEASSPSTVYGPPEVESSSQNSGALGGYPDGPTSTEPSAAYGLPSEETSAPEANSTPEIASEKPEEEHKVLLDSGVFDTSLEYGVPISFQDVDSFTAPATGYGAPLPPAESQESNEQVDSETPSQTYGSPQEEPEVIANIENSPTAQQGYEDSSSQQEEQPQGVYGPPNQLYGAPEESIPAEVASVSSSDQSERNMKELIALITQLLNQNGHLRSSEEVEQRPITSEYSAPQQSSEADFIPATPSEGYIQSSQAASPDPAPVETYYQIPETYQTVQSISPGSGGGIINSAIPLLSGHPQTYTTIEPIYAAPQNRPQSQFSQSLSSLMSTLGYAPSHGGGRFQVSPSGQLLQSGSSYHVPTHQIRYSTPTRGRTIFRSMNQLAHLGRQIRNKQVNVHTSAMASINSKSPNRAPKARYSAPKH